MCQITKLNQHNYLINSTTDSWQGRHTRTRRLCNQLGENKYLTKKLKATIKMPQTSVIWK